MTSNPLATKREIPKLSGTPMILGSILIGLVLASFTIISAFAGIIALSSGIVITVTILLRKTEYLIFAWFVLTGFIWLITTRLLPPHYYPFVGRGIFWGLLISAIGAWAIDNVLEGRQFLPFDNLSVKATIFIFLFWCTLSLFTSLDFVNSVKKLSHIFIALVASYMFYDFFSRDQNNIKKILAIVFFLATVISFVVVVLAGYSLISGIPIYKHISLWFSSPNVLGYLLFMCIPISIVAGHYCVPNKGLKFLFVGMMLLALFFSFHRTSWLATVVSIVFLLWKSRIKLPISIAMIAVLFLSALLFPVIGEDVYHYITEERYTGRIEIWRGAWNTACDYPLLGTGPGNSSRVMAQYIDTPWFRGQDSHSLYLRNAAEMGFASVIILFIFYAIFFYCSDRIEKNLKSEYLRFVTRGATATFVGLMIHGVFENGFFLTPFVGAEFHVILPYVLVVLPFAAKRLDERTTRPMWVP